MSRILSLLMALVLSVGLSVPALASSADTGGRVSYDQWAAGIKGSTGETIAPLPSDNIPDNGGVVVPHLNDTGSTRFYDVEFVRAEYVARADTPASFASGAIARNRLEFNSPSSGSLTDTVAGMSGPFTGTQATTTSGFWKSTGLQNIIPVLGATYTNGQDGTYPGYNWPSASWATLFPNPLSVTSIPDEIYLYYKVTLSESIADFRVVSRFQFGNNAATGATAPSITTLTANGTALYLIQDPTFVVDADIMNPVAEAVYAGNSLTSGGSVNVSSYNYRGLWVGGSSLNGALIHLQTSTPSAGEYYILLRLKAVSSMSSYSATSPYFLSTVMAFDASNGEYNFSNPGSVAGTVSPMSVKIGPGYGYSLVDSDGNVLNLPSIFEGSLETEWNGFPRVFDPFNSLNSMMTVSNKDQISSNVVRYTGSSSRDGNLLEGIELTYNWNSLGLTISDSLGNSKTYGYWQSSSLSGLSNGTQQIEQDANIAGKGLFASLSGFLSGLMEGLQSFLNTLTTAISSFVQISEKILDMFLKIPRDAIGLVSDILSVFPSEVTSVIVACFVMVLLFSAFKLFIGG